MLSRESKRLEVLAALTVVCWLTPTSAITDEPTDAENSFEGLTVHPIYHGSLVLVCDGLTVYIDPFGDSDRYVGLADPDLILITHSHRDHMDLETIALVSTDLTSIVAPSAVNDLLPTDLKAKARTLSNGSTVVSNGMSIEAVPMYNHGEAALKYHAKGDGNGYVISFSDLRVYVAGDTEDIPEMLDLPDVDVAFIPMNPPYTMSVERAADAVRAFRPRVVYPYHFRGSDIGEFKRLLEDDLSIEVRVLDWY